MTQHLPKVLNLGIGRGKAPLANWTSVVKGHGCGLLRKCDITQTPPAVDRNLAIVTPTDRVQSYEGNLAPGIARKDSANWTWVRVESTRARLTNNNSRPHQRQSQRPDDNNDDRTLDDTEDHLDPDSKEGHNIPSDEEEPGLEDLEQIQTNKKY